MTKENTPLFLPNQPISWLNWVLKNFEEHWPYFNKRKPRILLIGGVAYAAHVLKYFKEKKKKVHIEVIELLEETKQNNIALIYFKNKYKDPEKIDDKLFLRFGKINWIKFKDIKDYESYYNEIKKLKLDQVLKYADALKYFNEIKKDYEQYIIKFREIAKLNGLNEDPNKLDESKFGYFKDIKIPNEGSDKDIWRIGWLKPGMISIRKHNVSGLHGEDAEVFLKEFNPVSLKEFKKIKIHLMDYRDWESKNKFDLMITNNVFYFAFKPDILNNLTPEGIIEISNTICGLVFLDKDFKTKGGFEEWGDINRLEKDFEFQRIANKKFVAISINNSWESWLLQKKY